MPKSLVSTDKLAAIGTFSGASGQSYHHNSEETGSSCIPAFAEDQYVDVLFHAFEVTVILEELRGDHEQATELVRSSLASQTPRTPAPTRHGRPSWTQRVEVSRSPRVQGERGVSLRGCARSH
jgi:hypothetical protein